MADIQLFNFEGNAVRFVGTAEVPEWVGTDVVKVLHPNVRKESVNKYLAKVPEDWRGKKQILTPGGNQGMTTLYEPGLYFLLARSDSEIAVPFQRWLFEEVLPSIRQHGSYSMGMFGRVETVTPAWAQDLLDHQGPNRTLNETRASRYYKDMASENWKETPQGIAISESGELLDGQHRLKAIVRLGRPVRMFVVRNVPEEAKQTLDRGQMRTQVQALQIGGLTINALEVSTLRFATVQIGKQVGRAVYKTDSEIGALAAKFRTELGLAAKRHGSVSCRSSAIRAAVFRAAICHPDKHIELEEFLQILDQGLILSGLAITDKLASKATAPEALKALHLKYRGVKNSGPIINAELYAKALTAVKAFLDGRPVKALHPAKTQLFPVSELD